MQSSEGATQEQLQMLVGRALTDPSFRDWALADPAAAAQSMGIYLSQEQIARVKALDPAAVKALGVLFAMTVDATGEEQAVFWS